MVIMVISRICQGTKVTQDVLKIKREHTGKDHAATFQKWLTNKKIGEEDIWYSYGMFALNEGYCD